MAVMLPDSLVWIMEKLGLDWPDINEDEVHRAATLTRGFRDDLELIIQQVDSRIVTEVSGGVRGKAGEAYVAAWNTTRSQNLQGLLDTLDPIAVGIDGAGVVVTGLKVKVVAEITFTVATLVPLLAMGPLGAAGAVVKMVATKVATGIMVDLAISAVIEVVDGPVIGVLQDVIPGIVQGILDAPLVEDVGADMGEYYVDFEVLEQASSDMSLGAGDVETVVTQFMTDIADLHLTS